MLRVGSAFAATALPTDLQSALDERETGALLADAIEGQAVLVETVYEKGRTKELVYEISLVAWCNEQRRRQDRELSF